MQKTSILIAEDHKLVRETWSFVLQKDPRFVVLAETGTAEEAIELAKVLRPQVVILDINLPGMSGIEATPLIKKFSPFSRILAVSMHTQPVYARQIMQKGAMGYLTKCSSREEMFQALTEITAGRKYICHQIKDIISQQALSPNQPRCSINSLTQREMEIVELVRVGDSSKEIAVKLRLAVKTVEVHRYNILQKLKLKNASSLVNYMNTNQFI